MPNDIHAEVSRSSHLLVLASFVALASFVYWSSWAEIDQITRATGQVITKSRNQVIQALDGGVVEEILVKEGSTVKKGEVLMRLEKGRLEAAFLESQARNAALRAALARLSAEVFGGAPKFGPELDDYPEIRANHETLFKKRQSAINEELTALRKSLELANTELQLNLPLLKAGDVSKVEVLRLQRQTVEIQGVITNRSNKYFQDTQAELSKTQEDLDSMTQIMAQRKDQLEHTVITSPMDGVVRNVRITTQGGVVRSGEEIMQIVPVADDLIIEVKVRTSDIAFVKPGLSASVKLDAYDYSIFGAMSGVVTYISADTLSEDNRSINEPPYYRVHVKTNVSSFKGRTAERIEIQPGMTATVEIKTGSNTVLNYLVKPVTKTLSESMGER